jgi:hypothetical protein
MARTKSIPSNFRIVVEPRGLGDLGWVRTSASFLYGNGPDAEARISKDMQDRCEEIVSQIKRHVDLISYAGVEFDQPDVCEHCGYPWGEDQPNYNGGCCQKDQDAEDARLEGATP